MLSTKKFDAIAISLVAHFFGAIVVCYLIKVLAQQPVDLVKIMGYVAPLTLTLWCGIVIGMINSQKGLE